MDWSLLTRSWLAKLIIPILIIICFHGDTVFAVSRKYNVDMRTLVELSNLKPPYQQKRTDIKNPQLKHWQNKAGRKEFKNGF